MSSEEAIEILEIQTQLQASKEQFTQELQKLQNSFTAEIKELKDEVRELCETHKKNANDAI